MVADAMSFCSSVVGRYDTKTDEASKAFSFNERYHDTVVPNFRTIMGTSSNASNIPAYAPSVYATTCHLPIKDPGKGPDGVMDSWSSMPGRPSDPGLSGHFNLQ